MKESIKLGIKENWKQFSLLIIINAFVGAMIGLERSILPEIGEKDFLLAAKTAILSFIVVFGFTKAITNYLAGRLSDRYGRKSILVIGWLFAIPVPFMLMWANSWNLILLANVFLGISQGLTWSTTVIMKIDLVGPKNRGLAMGLNEFSGYLAVGITALITGYIAQTYGLRPQPFYPGILYVSLGLFLSVFLVKETRHHVAHEVKQHHNNEHMTLSQKEIFITTTFKDRNLSSVTQGGLVNNMNDGMAWGLFPLLYASTGLSMEKIGVLAAVYPVTWGIFQLLTGYLSDRWGRKKLIVSGMWLQAIGIFLTVLFQSITGYVWGAVLLGLGTAMVYPTFIAAIGDSAHPDWRASAVGVYRFWRDSGYAFGAILSGIIADKFGIQPAIAFIGILTFASGLLVLLRMNESLNKKNYKTECVSIDELKKLIMNEEVLLLDVRSEAEFSEGHIEHSINIPLNLIELNSGAINHNNIITICGKGGGRSEDAAILLRKIITGANVRSLCGGYQSYLKSE